MKIKKYWILGIIIIILVSSVIIFIKINMDKKDDDFTAMTKDEKNEILDNIEQNFNKDNKDVAVKVDDIEIFQSEVDLFEAFNNNSYINKYNKDDDKNNIEKIIENKVIIKDAEKKGILLAKEEIDGIENNINEMFDKDKDGVTELISKTKMTEEELYSYYINITKEAYLIAKWKENIINEILEGKIVIEDSEFNTIYEEMLNSKDMILLNKLVEIYIKYIMKDVEIYYMN